MRSRSSRLAIAILVLGAVLGAACKKSRLQRDPVAYVTSGPDGGPLVLRAALESFGIPVKDYETLKKECKLDAATGASVDDLEAVANERGLRARQVMVPAADVVSGAQELPSIAIVDTPDSLDFWLLWRREGDEIVIMDPRRGVVRMRPDEVRKALHVHEMDVPPSPEALASPVMVSRDGGAVHVRGSVVVTLTR
jgi:hypothetical protein